MTDPLHRLAQTAAARWGGLSPIGLPCVEHSSVIVGELYYWHAKCAAVSKNLTREQLAFAGWEDPFAKPSKDGWIQASNWTLGRLANDEDREVEMRGVRWLVDLGGTTAELSV